MVILIFPLLPIYMSVLYVLFVNDFASMDSLSLLFANRCVNCELVGPYSSVAQDLLYCRSSTGFHHCHDHEPAPGFDAREARDRAVTSYWVAAGATLVA